MLKSLHRRALAWLIIAASACGGGGTGVNNSVGPTTPTAPTPVLTTLSVSLGATTLQTGQTTTATVSGLDQNGAAFSVSNITFQSSNNAVATVSSNGTVTAVGPGTAQITAASGGKTASAPLTVIVGPTISSVRISLSATTAAQGQTAKATATALDQTGAPLSVQAAIWSSSNTTVATIDSSGTIHALAPGTTTITGRIDGHSGDALFTVTTIPVASVTVSPATVTLAIGATQQMSATTADAGGNILSGRQVTWSSSDPTKATVSPTGLVQAIAAGTATIVATSETKTGSASVTVAPTTPAPSCTPATGVKLNVGDIRSLSVAEIASLCLGGLATGSEYVLIPFNNSNVASSTTQIEISSTGTVAAATSPTLIPGTAGRLSVNRSIALGRAIESSFRSRELRDVGSLRTKSRIRKSITGVSATPAVGTVVQLNANLNGNTCSDPKVLHAARIVAVTQHAIVFLDNTSPAGGYTDAELTAFANSFDAVGFALDTTNFGANTDIDNNGRVGIFFTPGINQLPGPVGGVIGGLFAGRDLFPATTSGCIASNEGEMFYMPVPDPNKVINGNYSSKSFVASLVEPTLVHEFQHLINAGRRVYVNDAQEFEQVWLNEGLSHIAEELLYYAESGNAPGQNIDLTTIKSSQAQVDAFNNDQSQNFGRLSSYMAAPSMNSPYALIDGLEMRGAIWQLLRYSADQKGGDQRATWRALVNTTTNGQTNYDAVFGDIVSHTRSWAVAQFMDDIGFAVPAQYTHPSWNFRSVYSGLASKKLPLTTNPLVAGTKVQLTIVGGGAAYIRFGVSSGVATTIAATSQGQAVPPNVDFILARTK